MRNSDVIVAVLVVAVVVLIIMPLSTFMMDVLLILNLALSLLILLTALYMKSTLEFSAFPTLLLLVTLFRLSLTIASTRLILGNGGEAGRVIETFGSFVAGGNLVVGFIMFIIIMLMQFIVITKGSERVAEVAARFTLDAMPGKQMAIDADLNSGIIDENEAKQRRQDVQRESDFYGAMDGASKFIKGDAILGIIVVFVNIIGGFAIGALSGRGMDIGQVLAVYALVTVGSGLSLQLSALMVSTAAGIIVTRSANDTTFGTSLFRQLGRQSGVLYVLGGVLAALAFIPGMPTFPLLLLGLGIPGMGYIQSQKRKRREEEARADTAEQSALERRKPESVTSLLQVDLIEMEFGYGLLSLVDASQGGDLLDRVVMIRRQCAMDLGVIVPVVHLRDNIQLPANAYSIKLRGLEVAGGEVLPDHFLALKPAEEEDTVEGIPTTEPAFGLPALWIGENVRDRAEMLGYTAIDAPSVIATHLMETLKRHAGELLTRQQVQTLLDNLKRKEPALVEEVSPKMFSVGEIQKVLANLLGEGVSIRDMGAILEIIADYGNLTRDPDMLTEYVRQGMKRAITRQHVTQGKLRVITLDPALEQTLAEGLRKTDQGQAMALEPAQLQRILAGLRQAVERAAGMGSAPVLLTKPGLRRHVKKLASQIGRDIAVLSYQELEQDVEIFAEGMVR